MSALNVKPEDLMNSILGKLYDTLTNGDESVPKSDDNYLSWCTPGIPYDEKDFDFLKEGFRGYSKKSKKAAALETVGEGADTDVSDSEDTDGEDDEMQRADDAFGKYNAAEAFAILTDFIPDASGIDPANKITSNVWNAENRLSKVYDEILTFSQVPDDEIDEATKEKVDKLRGYLSKTVKVKELNDALEEVEVEKIVDSPMKQKYMEKMAAYEDAVLQYNSKRINALSGSSQSAVHDWAMNANIYRNKVKAAMYDWVSNGYKLTYERINAFISQVEGRSMMLMKQRYMDDFEKSKITGANSGMEFLYSSLVPAGFVKNGGWTTFEFTEGDFHSDYSNSSQGFSGNVGLSIGAFSLGANGGYTKKESETSMNMKNFKLEFDMCQVQIARPYLNLNFIKSPYWRFQPDSSTHSNQMISDGKTPPGGRAPVITTSCIFIRNLKLKFGSSSSMTKKFEKEVKGGGTVGWGPFMLGGQYAKADANGSMDSNYSSQGITVNGMQLIGFKCHILPKSPNPNTNIKNWV